MKVKELIEKLKEYPDNFEIVFETNTTNDLELEHIYHCNEENKIILLVD
jgi:5S rRNA maturation endonuclease (ribonuclease M5)